MGSTKNEVFYYFNVNGISIPYSLIKSSRRRSISVRIDIGGKMTVRSPYFVSKGMVERFLLEKQDWIYKHYVEAMKKAAKPDDSSFNSGDCRDLDNGDLRSPIGTIEDPALVNKHKKYARNIFEARVSYFQQFTGGTYHSISIRDQKTRWGSCSGRGNLSFNWRLILAPPEILDYVVVHELCHLTHMNHSKDFWGLVGKVLPDYKDRRKWLKENGHTLRL